MMIEFKDVNIKCIKGYGVSNLTEYTNNFFRRNPTYILLDIKIAINPRDADGINQVFITYGEKGS